MRWRFLASSLATVIAVALAQPTPALAAAPATQAEWSQAVQRRITSRLDFPREARDITGPVRVSLKITVRRDGTIDDIAVARSSGNDAVDKATVGMVWRAGPLPAFSADMPEAKTSLMLPVRFQQEESDPPAPAPRRYVDPATGFGATVSAPWQIAAARAPGKVDALIEISNPEGFPPLAPGARFLCRAGFTATQPDAAKPKTPQTLQALEAQAAAATRRQRKLRGDIEQIDTFELNGVRGIESLVAPGTGPGHEDTRQYIAEWNRPEGHIRLTCATTRDAMPNALDPFRKIRDGLSVNQR